MSNAKFRLMVNPVVSDLHPLYKPVLVSRGVVNLDFIAGLISDKSAQSRGDVIGTVISLGEALHTWLSEGYTVDLGPLGRFEQVVRSKEPITDPLARVAELVEFARIFYRPEVTIVRSLKRQHYERERSNELLWRPDSEERRKQILEMIDQSVSLTATKAAEALQMRFTSARLHLDALVDEGVLRKSLLSGRTYYLRA